MGCYDTINVYQQCPYCHRYQSFDAQTKDLGSSMYCYDTLSEKWFKKSKKWNERKFRLGLPVFPRFPKDKSAKVWKSQAERIEAEATVPEEFKNLKFISVIADCHSNICDEWATEKDMRTQGCKSGFGRMFEGKIRIKKGMLIGDIYDIELKDKKFPKERKIKRKPQIITPEAALNDK